MEQSDFVVSVAKRRFARFAFVAVATGAVWLSAHHNNAYSQDQPDPNPPKQADVSAQKLPDTKMLLHNLKSKDVATRRQAATYLNQLDPDYNTELFDEIANALTLAIEDKDLQVGDLAAKAFSRIRCGSYPPNDRLVELLDSPRPEVVKRAIKALRENGSQAFESAEGIQNLSDPSAPRSDRLRALKLLATEGGSEGYVSSLAVRACKDPNAEVRVAALKVLEARQCSGAAATYFFLAKDSDPSVRKAALSAMHSTGEKRFAPALKDATKDPDASVSKLAKSLYKDVARGSGPASAFWAIGEAKFIDTKLGNMVLNEMGSMAVYDTQRGLFLAKGGDCDGASTWMALSSEPGAEHIPGALADMVEAPIGNIKTGKGIGLGDIREKVQKVFGKPTRVRKVHGKTIDIYKYGSKECYYEATYTYRGGHVVGICIFQDNGEC